ncbi:PTS transporter subunit EIIC [Borreliella valaisiana]|uniref:PTS transporter subunit EIIC n=1 Tax=Borreliella valaisiana TaxID=62088 RepID=UPI0004E7CFFD|nr:PTS transporter subunit EIIC [Borreliella valaisiana]AIJ29490.1 PTS mannose transporter subunit IIB [Borreliella valaisiana Tom4006]WLN24940.1 PTS transporter subunit EIIC [Borreliella valaisiana]
MINFIKIINFSSLQKFSKALRVPISVLPVSCLLIGIGSVFSNSSNIVYVDKFFFQDILGLMKAIGNAILLNMPLIFSIGISIGVARIGQGTAALAGLIGYLTFNITENYFIETFSGLVEADAMSSMGRINFLGVQTLNTGIAGSLVVGLVVGYLHNKFYNIKLPKPFIFFSECHFVPVVIIMPFCVILAIFFCLIWSSFDKLIASLGIFVFRFDYLGSFLYGFLNRLLLPLGLHSILSFPFEFTSLGGVEMINGETFRGLKNIFYAQLIDPSLSKFSSGFAKISSGFYISIMFGLPGAALGVYKGIVHEDKSKVAALLFSGALTAFLTGITEPLEFLFIFTAPLLYFVHSIYSGLALLLANFFDVTIGSTFSNGFLDFFMFGILQGNSKTNWINVVPLGVIFFTLYYFTFSWLYRYFDFQIFVADDPFFEGQEGKLESLGIAHLLIQGLGGFDNITKLDVCSTRLHIDVVNTELVDNNLLKEAGVLKIGFVNGKVQLFYGSNAYYIKKAIDTYSPKSLFETSVMVAVDNVKKGFKTYVDMREDKKLEKQGKLGKTYKLSESEED